MHLGELREQQPGHLVYRQINVSIYQHLLIRVPLGLMRAYDPLRDSEEQ